MIFADCFFFFLEITLFLLSFCICRMKSIHESEQHLQQTALLWLQMKLELRDINLKLMLSSFVDGVEITELCNIDVEYEQHDKSFNSDLKNFFQNKIFRVLCILAFVRVREQGYSCSGELSLSSCLQFMCVLS